MGCMTVYPSLKFYHGRFCYYDSNQSSMDVIIRRKAIQMYRMRVRSEQAGESSASHALPPQGIVAISDEAGGRH